MEIYRIEGEMGRGYSEPNGFIITVALSQPFVWSNSTSRSPLYTYKHLPYLIAQSLHPECRSTYTAVLYVIHCRCRRRRRCPAYSAQ